MGPYPGQPGFQPIPQAPPFDAPQPVMDGESGYVGEDAEVKRFDFSNKSIRRGFIRKVYSILVVQLLISTGFISLFFFHEPTKQYTRNHIEIFIIFTVVALLTMIILSCCGQLRRIIPWNSIFLFILTVAESFGLAITASTFNAKAVLIAVGITGAVCLGLTLFTFQTKCDFTMCTGALVIAIPIVLMVVIVSIFVCNDIINWLYASMAALLYTLYLVCDTQLMLGGNHIYSFSPEEYVFAVLCLHLDIINILMNILAIIGEVNSK